MKKLSRTEWIAVAVAILVVAVVFFFPQLLRYGKVASVGQQPQQKSIIVQNPQPMTSADGLVITDTEIGTGTEAKAGNTVAVQYTGMFQNGQVFDSSIPRGEPLTFVLGAPGLIEGFSRGTLGMKVGGKRTIVIPPALGYGDVANGPIPANSTLVFQLELVSVQ